MNRIVTWSWTSMALVALAGCGWNRPVIRPESPMTTVLPAHYREYQPIPMRSRPIDLADAVTSEPPARKPAHVPDERANELPSVPPVPWTKEIGRELAAQKNQDRATVSAAAPAQSGSPVAVVEIESSTDPEPAPKPVPAAPVAKAPAPKAAPAAQATPGRTDPFQQLSGQLSQWRKTWRLRYAGVGADDPYGGSVVLDGLTNVSKLRDGQHVRVRGQIVPPASRQESPRYVVQSIELLD